MLTQLIESIRSRFVDGKHVRNIRKLFERLVKPLLCSLQLTAICSFQQHGKSPLQNLDAAYDRRGDNVRFLMVLLYDAGVAPKEMGKSVGVQDLHCSTLDSSSFRWLAISFMRSS